MDSENGSDTTYGFYATKYMDLYYRLGEIEKANAIFEYLRNVMQKMLLTMLKQVKEQKMLLVEADYFTAILSDLSANVKMSTKVKLLKRQVNIEGKNLAELKKLKEVYDKNLKRLKQLPTVV